MSEPRKKERNYSIEWRKWCRAPVDDVIDTLQQERDRILAAGNEQVLVDIGEDWEGRPDLRLVGIRLETEEERKQREAEERQCKSRLKASSDEHLKDAFKYRTKEEIDALWEKVQQEKK